tara:strand:+ start:168 stop:674 length:507 start_codon:yes stop_codon:yes gene_type:complete
MANLLKQTTMANLKLTPEMKNELMTVDILSNYTAGSFRMVVKTRLGMTICDTQPFDNPRLLANPQAAIAGYKRGTLQTVQFSPEGTGVWLTIFSRTGKKVKLIDRTILSSLTVGTINGMFDNTNLYNPIQYSFVGATSWASKAFVDNKVVVDGLLDKEELAELELKMS